MSAIDLLDAVVFFGELAVVVFGSLFLVLLAAEVAEWWKERRGE
jgi:hypothetical protein